MPITYINPKKLSAWLVVILSMTALTLPQSRTNAPVNFRFGPVSREVIEARLKQYAGSDKEREATLKRIFDDAGCDGQHVSEQAVKGSKLPNVICALPGRSDKVICRSPF